MENNRPLRICMIGHKTFPKGAVRQLRHCLALMRYGHEIDIIALQNENELPEEKYMEARILRIPLQKDRSSRIHYIYCYFKSLLSMSITLAREFLNRKYDIIYIFTLPDFMIFAGMFPKFLGARIVADHLDPMPELYQTKYNGDIGLPYQMLKLSEKLSMKIPDGIITQNHCYGELLTQRGVNPKKIQVLHNAPDPLFWGKPRSPEWQIAPNQPIKLMFHGTITERSGLAEAIKAVSGLREKGIDVRLRIVGSGDYDASVKMLINDLKLWNIIEWFGLRSPNEIPGLIEEVDIGLVPNQSSPFSALNLPNRVLEYLWMGKAVITSRNKGVERYFPEDSVFYVAPNEPKSIESMIFQLIQDKTKQDVCMVIEKGQRICNTLTWANEEKVMINFTTAKKRSIVH